MIGWFVALVGWSCVIAFFDLGGGPAFEMTDCWVAQTARETQAHGNWFVPVFSGDPRYHKSPGPYWAVMAVSTVRGEPVDKVAARIPSAASAVLLVAVVFWLALHIGGERAAVFAGFAAASSVMILHWSHRAASDLGLASLVATSLACVWIGSNCRPPGAQRVALWLAGYFFAGAGMLYKMPMPLVCVGLPAVAYVLIRNRWGILRNWWHLVGLLLFLLPWVPWVIGILLHEPDALLRWRVEFLDRFTGELPNVAGHSDWMHYLEYPATILALLLPYTLSLPAAFVRAVRRDPVVNRDGMWFMLVWFGVLFIFFMVSIGKEPRYILPAIPPLFVLLGCELAAFFRPGRSVSETLLRFASWAIWILIPLGLAGGAYALDRWVTKSEAHSWSNLWPAYIVVAVVFLAGTYGSLQLFRAGQRNASFAALVAMMWVVFAIAWPTLLETTGRDPAIAGFSRQLRERIPVKHREDLRFVGSPDSRVIWQSGVPVPRVMDQLALLEKQGGSRDLATEERLIGTEVLRRLGERRPALFVARRLDYERLLAEGPELAATEGIPFIRPYLWIETDTGKPAEQYVVFGNVPPPGSGHGAQPSI